MEPYKVELDSLVWETPMSGVRIKAFRDEQAFGCFWRRCACCGVTRRSPCIVSYIFKEA
jgi:hypothetical protein